MSLNFSNNFFRDVDAHAQSLTGYDQSYQQLSRGQFKGEFSTANFGQELGVYFETLNLVLDQSGSVPNDQYSIMFLMNEDEPATLHGNKFTSGDFFLGHPGSSFQTLSRPGTSFCVVSLEKVSFTKLHTTYRNDEKLGIERFPSGSHQTSPSCIASMRFLVKHLQGAIKSENKILSNTASAANYHSLLVDSASECIASVAHESQSDSYRQHLNHIRVVQKAQELIRENVAEGVSVASLCRQINISRRALEYSFQACLGQPPAAYLRKVRLNEIRRALLAPENMKRSIGEIASESGMWHQSRFAQYYRNLFGELPSQTRTSL